ncbi:MAG: hypothetical protein A2958_00020 [Candidatus Levybacteria bacterium RIFCSPLOWO2_01_FULL_38_13]|nr:MAG: hypothetical protein A2958_00020 [Candidatus Levybacteria bacterium RIFCSPLOWO2_01_FULL_38_13]
MIKLTYLQNKFTQLVKILKPFRMMLLMLFFIGVFVDVLLPVGSDIRLFPLLLLWIFIIQFFAFKSTATLKVALGFLGVVFFLFLFARNHPSLDRFSTWIYFFLLIGIIQQFREISSQKK